MTRDVDSSAFRPAVLVAITLVGLFLYAGHPALAAERIELDEVISEQTNQL